MDGIDEVEIKGRFCEVSVTGYSGSTTYFEGAITGSSRGDYTIEYDRSGSSLEIWVDSPRNNWSGSIRGELKLRVPENTLVVVDNSSGAVFANNLSTSETRLEASSGKIEAENINGDLYIETSSGSIELDGLVGDLMVESSSGSQRITDVVGNIDGKSSSGRIRFFDIEGDIEAVTTSGGISLDNVKGGLELESSSGSLNGEEIEITADSYFKSSSGSIDMELVNDVNSLRYDLSASSGSLRVGDKRSDDRLIDRRASGPEIRGVSSSGSQRYYN